ncbi:MAG: ABC transporter permease [Halobacteria archaeon]
MALLRDAAWIAWREMLHFTRSRVSISMAVVQPLFWLLLFGNLFTRFAAVPGFPADSYLAFMTPGILAMTMLFGGVYAGMTVVWDRRVGYLNKLLALPIPRASILLGKMGAQTVRAGVPALVIFLLALAQGVQVATGVPGALLTMVFALLLCFSFSGISLVIGALTRQPETFWSVTSFFTFPLLFVSSALVPLEFMPGWLQGAALLNPVTHAIEPMRALLVRGWEWSSILPGAAATAGFAGFLVLLSARLFTRRAELSVL